VKAASASMDNGHGSGRVADRYGKCRAYAVSSAPGIVEDNNVAARGGPGRGEGVGNSRVSTDRELGRGIVVTASRAIGHLALRYSPAAILRLTPVSVSDVYTHLLRICSRRGLLLQL